MMNSACLQPALFMIFPVTSLSEATRRLSASDFTHMNELGITIQGQSFSRLIYHLVLTYSNW